MVKMVNIMFILIQEKKKKKNTCIIKVFGVCKTVLTLLQRKRVGRFGRMALKHV